MDRESLKDLWGALALRGMFTILFGIAAVFWPGITTVTLVYLFGSFILVSGIINQVMGITNLSRSGGWNRALLVVLGLLETVVGVYLLRHPTISGQLLIILIAATLIVGALFQIYEGIFGEGSSTWRVLGIMSGVISGAAGIILLMYPAKGGVAFVWVIGLYALISGPMILALAFDAKKAAAELEE